MCEAPSTVRAVLDDIHVCRLFKCALKDDEALLDSILEKLYCSMKEFDASRTRDAIEMMVDRDATARLTFRALLDELWPRRPIRLCVSK
jgi:NADH:ubiquinone oxidoreductase subunit E